MLKLFYSYSHKDAKWRAKLAAHLTVLKSSLLDLTWYDCDILPGRRWEGEISSHIDQADIVVLLVSADFISSEYCAVEAERAIERQSAGEAVVVPVLLSACNLSQSAFEHLQTVPPLDKPIKSWRDKDQAFTEVSRKIEGLASNFAGARMRGKFLSRDYKGFSNLLHLLCDRAPQRESLRAGLLPANRKERRPFIIVLRGAPLDALDRFLTRLREFLLPRFLGEKPGLLSPLIWPELQPERSPFELFASRLEEILPVKPFATQTEMNTSLKTLNPVSLLPSFIGMDEISSDRASMIDLWIRLWEEWPRLPEGRTLIPVLALEGTADDLERESARPMPDTVSWFKSPNLAGVVLPPLSLVKHADFRDWLREDQVRVRFESPERAVERSYTMEKIFPVRMLPLADTHLPRFLELL